MKNSDNLCLMIFSILILMTFAMYQGFIVFGHLRDAWNNPAPVTGPVKRMSLEVRLSMALSLALIILSLDFIHSIFLLKI